MKEASRLVVLSASLLIHVRARADCWLTCMERSGCWGPARSDDYCGYNNGHMSEMCKIQCRGAAANSWGAIAYSWKEKASGWSYNQSDKAAAERVAIQSCIKAGGAKCAIETTFNDACGALAADGEIVGWGTGAEKFSAQYRARVECAKAGGKKCEAVTAICSIGGGGTNSGTPSPPPAPRAISWGAIAYSTPDRGVGWSQGKEDRATAEKEAIKSCSQRGRACVVRTAFNKQCGAAAMDGGVAGWASSVNQKEAQQKAVDDCKKAGGKNCVVHISFCSM